MKDNLHKIEIEILEKIYSKEHELDFDINLSASNFNLKGDALPNQELGFYLERLKRLNYLDFKDKVLSRAGQRDEKYKTNVINIWWDDIHITYKGKKFVQEHQMTVVDKVRLSILEFLKDIKKEMRARIISHIITFLLGISFSYLYYIMLIK